MNFRSHAKYSALLSALLLTFAAHPDADARSTVRKSADHATARKIAMTPDDAG